MKKTGGKIVWGIVLIVAGVLFALKATNLVQFDIFFDGWWTLFIIIPCAVGLFTGREKVDNLIGLGIGVVLLLCCQDILSFSLLWKLLVPAIIVIIGLKLVLGGLFGSKAGELITDMKEQGKTPANGFAAFSGSNLNYDGQIFEGAELTAVFGGIECDLRNAVIEKDCAIKVSAVFGGIDILVSDQVNVKTNVAGIFGGTSNKTAPKQNVPTLYISGTAMFGGVEIK